MQGSPHQLHTTATAKDQQQSCLYTLTMAKHQLHPAKFNIYKCQTSFKSLTPQHKTKKLTTRTTKMGDHQHHHPWHFPLRVCLALFAPSHQRQFLSQAAAKRKQNISIKNQKTKYTQKNKNRESKTLNPTFSIFLFILRKAFSLPPMF